MGLKVFNSRSARFAFISVTAILASLAVFAWVTVPRFFYPMDHADSVEAHARANGLDPYLVMAVIKAESGFKADARSGGGALGLMQVTDATASWIAGMVGKEYNVRDLLDPEANIGYGCWYLGWLMLMFGDERTALAAYNSGHNNVLRWLGDEEVSMDGLALSKIPYRETANFVRRVQSYRDVYVSLYPGRWR
ncbi:MAG: lytic transglycosylase domain-containing protein [Oscillospiraceae bacterium]|nr:lytic transglycosylase domain-containing protein [Oscillospiraceae bacterium]